MDSGRFPAPARRALPARSCRSIPPPDRKEKNLSRLQRVTLLGLSSPNSLGAFDTPIGWSIKRLAQSLHCCFEFRGSQGCWASADVSVG